MTNFNEITITNNFMFATVMQNEEICKEFLETMLEIKIEKIVYTENEKQFKADPFSKGIRHDVFVKDSDRQFDLEMQCVDTYEIPLRARYYQSLFDVSFLDAGHSYTKLPETYVLFICPFDLFKKDLPIYTFENICVEDKNIKMNDKTQKVFYNTTAWKKEPNPAKRALLKYFNEKSPQNSLTDKMEKLVEELRNRREWREKYMTLEQELDLRYERGYDVGVEDGITQGISQGISQGIAQGVHQKAVETAMKLISRSISSSDIADITGLSLSEIQSLQN